MLQIKQQQEDLKFQKCYNTIKELISKPERRLENSVNIIRIAEQRLATVLENVTKIHRDLCLVSDGHTEVEAWFKGIFDMFNDISIEIDVFCDGQEHVVTPSTSVAKPVGIRLERVRFDIFDGSIRKYPAFRTEFLKHIKPLHHPHEEVVVLKSYLASDIRKDVDSVNDISELWERLDKKYGDEGKLVDSIMSDIKNIKNCRNTVDTLLLIETIEKAHNDLKILGMEKELAILLSLV